MRIFILIFTLTFLFSACDNTIDLTEERKDIPVVYGLLNPSDTAQYIRIERAFIDDNISALEIAQIPDSLYYSNAVAQIVDVEDDVAFPLTMVDGNLEGYLRDQGVFAQAPNYLYKLSNADFIPIDNKRYRFELQRADNLPVVTAETSIVDNPTIVAPGATQSMQFFYDLSGPNAVFIPTHFEWKLTSGVVFDLTLRLKYLESINGGPFEDLFIDWTFAKNIQQLEFDLDGAGFYSFMAARIEEDPQAVRAFKNVDFIITSGGQEVLDYVNVVNANLGITSSQDIPNFTNLSEGVGLFSSRNTIRREDIPLTPSTLDSLRDGFMTKNLNFN